MSSSNEDTSITNEPIDGTPAKKRSNLDLDDQNNVSNLPIDDASSPDRKRSHLSLVSNEPSDDPATACPNKESVNGKNSVSSDPTDGVGTQAETFSHQEVINGSNSVSNETTNDAPIHKLNDKCLQHIFELLPFVEREKKTIVCKRWKLIIRNMWGFENELDTTNGTPFEIPKKHRNLPFLKKIFKRFNLRKLTLQGNKIADSGGVVADLVDRCPKLEEVSFYKVSMNGYKVNLLASLENLTKLVLHDCDSIRDSNMKFVLRDNRQLTHLEITNCANLGGSFLKHLRAPLETLILCCHKKLNTEYLGKNKQLPSTLKHLNLSAIKKFDCQGHIGDLVECYPNLRSLTLAKYGWFNFNGLTLMPAFEGLKVLNVAFNKCISVYFLEQIITRNLRLKSLDISGSGIDKQIAEEKGTYNISDLNKMPNLQSLNLSYLKKMDCDEITKYAAKSPPVEYLYLVALPNLKDDHVKSLLTLCPKLKHLDLSRCSEITGDILQAANEALKLRTNNQPLHLVVGGTKIQPSQTNEENKPASGNHHLLSVSYKDTHKLMKSYYIYGWKDFSVSKDDDIRSQQIEVYRSRIRNILGPELTPGGYGPVDKSSSDDSNSDDHVCDADDDEESYDSEMFANDSSLSFPGSDDDEEEG